MNDLGTDPTTTAPAGEETELVGEPAPRWGGRLFGLGGFLCWRAASWRRLGTSVATGTGHGDCRAGARLRARGACRDGRAKPRDHIGDLAGHDRRICGRGYLCPRDRLYRQAQRRHWRAASRPATCWRSSRRRSSTTRFRRTKSTLTQLEASLQQAEANAKLAAGDLGPDNPWSNKAGRPSSRARSTPDRES